MRQLLLSGLLALETGLLAVPAVAQSSERQDCAATLQSVKRTIEDGREVRVISIDVRDVSSSYSNYPSDRPVGYELVLAGAAAPSVMHSPQFMSTLSRTILGSCRDASQVTFGVHRTDWAAIYGLVNDEIIPFDCIEPDRRRQQIEWGYHVCL